MEWKVLSPSAKRDKGGFKQSIAGSKGTDAGSRGACPSLWARSSASGCSIRTLSSSGLPRPQRVVPAPEDLPGCICVFHLWVTTQSRTKTKKISPQWTPEVGARRYEEKEMGVHTGKPNEKQLLGITLVALKGLGGAAGVGMVLEIIIAPT